MIAIIEPEALTKDSHGRKGNTNVKNTGKDTWDGFFVTTASIFGIKQIWVCIPTLPVTSYVS